MAGHLLWWAAGDGHSAVIKVLLDSGKVKADSKDENKDQMPPSSAAENGHEAVVKGARSVPTSITLTSNCPPPLCLSSFYNWREGQNAASACKLF